MSMEVEVFVNSVRLINVFDLSIDYKLVPEVATCKISLVDEGGQYIRGDIRGDSFVAEQETLSELSRAAERRGIVIDHSVPIFKDNDTVAVFGKKGRTYKWLFHGFVSTMSFGDAVTGRKTITLSCESGLKSLRHNFIVMNSFLFPEEFSEEELRTELMNMMSVFQSIAVQNMPYWEKIRLLFVGGEVQQHAGEEATVVFRHGEGRFSVEDVELGSPSSIWEHMKQLEDDCDTGTEDIVALEIFLKKNDDPARKKLMVVRIGNSEYMKQLEDAVFGTFAMNPPVYVSKMSILQNIIQPLGFVAFTLPNGDVVVEPFLNGVIGGSSWVDAEDMLNCSYSFVGSNIGNTALTRYSHRQVGTPSRTVQAAFASLRRDEVTTDADSVRAFGLRLIRAEEMVLNPQSEEQASLYGRFLIARSWSSAKTANVSAKYRGRGGINRPIYIQSLDAWFLTTSYSLSWNPSGAEVETYGLGFGLMWDGTKWGTDLFYAYSSHLQLLHTMVEMIGAKRRGEEFATPQLEIMMPKTLGERIKEMRVMRIAEEIEGVDREFPVSESSPLRFNPSAYFTSEVRL